ncbi:MAG: hypothetical protein ACPGO3_09490 [Magnetospiraceae bacterium]
MGTGTWSGGPTPERLFEGAYSIYRDTIPAGYRLEQRFFHKKTGFLANLLRPAISVKHRMVAISGTRWFENGRPTIRDAIADLNMGIDQFLTEEAADLRAQVLAYAEKGFDIHFTGHSLGDSLGKAFAYDLEKTLRAAKKRAPRGRVTAMGFSGFGATELISALNDGDFEAEVSDATDPVTYYFAADPIPRIGTHTGQTLAIPDDTLLRADWLESLDRDHAGLLGLLVHHHRVLRPAVEKQNGLRRAVPRVPTKFAWATEIGDPSNTFMDFSALRDRVSAAAERVANDLTDTSWMEDGQAEVTAFFDNLILAAEADFRKRRHSIKARLRAGGQDLVQSMIRFGDRVADFSGSGQWKDTITALQSGLNLMISEGATEGASGKMVAVDGAFGPETRSELMHAVAEMGPSALDAALTMGKFYRYLKTTDIPVAEGLARVVDTAPAVSALQRALNHAGTQKLADSWRDIAEDGTLGTTTAAALRAVLAAVSAEKIALAFGHELELF